MKRARTFMIVFIVETIGVLMFLGCSSPKNKKTSDAPMDTAMIYEDMPQETSVSKVGINSSQSTLVSPKKTDATSALDLSINPYYDAVIRVRRMGIMMVSRIYEAILSTMLADIRERKGRSMSWGMKKDMMPASMMALLIVTMIQRRKNSGFIEAEVFGFYSCTHINNSRINQPVLWR